jgi:hypothetical protein
MAFHFNGFGTMHIGRRDYRADGSYITTEFLIIGYIPICPLRSFRLFSPEHFRRSGLYSSKGTLVVEELPTDGRQARCVYGMGALFVVWTAFLAWLSTWFEGLWDHYPTATTFGLCTLIGSLMCLPWHLRRRSQARAPFSTAALVATLERIGAIKQVPSAPGTPPPLPRRVVSGVM